MNFTSDKRIPLGEDDPFALTEPSDSDTYRKTFRKGDPELKIFDGNPFLESDIGIVIHKFESSCQDWAETDYAQVYLYRDVYGTENFSARVREQMNYYPGMHNQGNPTGEDPFQRNAEAMGDRREAFWNNAMDNPDAFMSGLQSRQNDFNLNEVFGENVTSEQRKDNAKKLLLQCVPCFDRLLDMDMLLPDGDLLELHLLNIKIRTDILKKIRAMFKDPGFMIDICEILKMFSHLCPQDLLAILALLTQYLAKLNLEIKFNLNFIIQLIGPILSPFLDALAAWLDKWIQLILAPLICVLDHINETINVIRRIKMPFGEISANVGLETNIAGFGHRNAFSDLNIGGSTGLANEETGTFGPNIGAWGDANLQAFNTPKSERYNPERPSFPSEETKMSIQEAGEAWKPSFSEEEKEERSNKWRELRQNNNEKRMENSKKRREKRDGTRWSKDDIPASEKFAKEGDFNAGRYRPPEDQEKMENPSDYVMGERLVASVVQLRNIMQGGIQYIQDWFNYITQMINDLLGVDIGWMSKKSDSTILKSRIIELIYIVKAIVQAISKNGLKCGIDSNFSPEQMRYILEEELNPMLPAGTQFDIQPNGQVRVAKGSPVSVNDNSKNKQTFAFPRADGTISTDATKTSSEQFLTVKDCFSSASEKELKDVKQWISDFERRNESK